LRDLTIYRPTVIAGDSQTGYTSTYHGLYVYLKLMSVICRNVAPGPDGVRHTPVQLQMTGDEPRNVVPVDWVSAGRTYHLAPNEPVTPRRTIEAGYTYFNSRGVEFTGAKELTPQPVSNLDQVARDNMSVYEPYETTDPNFDATNLRRYLPDLPCPSIDEAMLHRYWRFGEQDRWGKRRWPKPIVPFHVHEYLDRQLQYAGHGCSLASNPKRCWVGLDVHGPGGGQWQLEFAGECLASIEAGLPTEDYPVAHVSSCDLLRLAEKHQRLTYDVLVHLAVSNAGERSELGMALTSGFPASTAANWLGQRDAETEGIAAASRVVDGT
jgi:hypothetical protein